MPISLESQPCPQCQQENSVHISNCHVCGTELPWAEIARSQILAESVSPPAKPPVSKTKVISLYIGGALIFMLGVLEWALSAMLRGRPFSAAAYIMMLFGGALWKIADGMLLDVDDPDP